MSRVGATSPPMSNVSATPFVPRGPVRDDDGRLAGGDRRRRRDADGRSSRRPPGRQRVREDDAGQDPQPPADLDVVGLVGRGLEVEARVGVTIPVRDAARVGLVPERDRGQVLAGLDDVDRGTSARGCRSARGRTGLGSAESPGSSLPDGSGEPGGGRPRRHASAPSTDRATDARRSCPARPSRRSRAWRSGRRSCPDTASPTAVVGPARAGRRGVAVLTRSHAATTSTTSRSRSVRGARGRPRGAPTRGITAPV